MSTYPYADLYNDIFDHYVNALGSEDVEVRTTHANLYAELLIANRLRAFPERANDTAWIEMYGEFLYIHARETLARRYAAGGKAL